MSITDWIEEGSDNTVLHIVELPLRWIAILVWMNAIILAAAGTIAGVVLVLRAVA